MLQTVWLNNQNLMCRWISETPCISWQSKMQFTQECGWYWWHVWVMRLSSFFSILHGYADTLTDQHILNSLHLVGRLIDGSYNTVKEEATVIHYKIGHDILNKTFMFVDGVHPKYSICWGNQKMANESQRQFMSQWER